MSKRQNHFREKKEVPVKVVSEFSIDDDNLQQRIAKKAYELYERRGCCHGFDVDDWLEAERIVLGELEIGNQTQPQVPLRQGQRTKRG